MKFEKKVPSVISEKTKLMDSLAVLEEQVKSARQAYLEAFNELSQLEKNVKTLNSGSRNLDTILASERVSGSNKELGFHGESS